MRILSICTSAGLFDKPFIETGHEVIAGCEIEAHKRNLYKQWCGEAKFICHDLADLPDAVRGAHFDLVIGGPSCQAHSRLKSIRKPKFPDLTPLVNNLLDAVSYGAYLFENVVAIDIPGSTSVALDAMHFPVIHNGKLLHQSRLRHFTFSPNLTPPRQKYSGTSTELVAYPAVVGKLYGAKRAAIIQGFPTFTDIDAPSKHIQEALADGVPRGLTEAWIEQIQRWETNSMPLSLAG